MLVLKVPPRPMMKPRPSLAIHIPEDIEPFVLLGDLKKSGQWVEFYTLLAVNRTASSTAHEYTTREVVRGLACWHHNKTAKSSGHEISRHIDEIARKTGANFIGYREKYKTKAWRLELDPRDIEFIPGRAVVEQWLRSRQVGRRPEHEWIDELRRLVDAQLELMQGVCDHAIDGLSKQDEYYRPEFDAWAAALVMRAVDLLKDAAEDSTALDHFAQKWDQARDPAGMSVAARIHARIGLRNRFQSLTVQRERLSKLASTLEARGDISALAVVLNVLGLLTRRNGDPQEAIVHHARAVALFGICGDFNSMQAAVFNLALCHDDMFRNHGTAPSPHSIELVKMCIDICAGLGVGRDSMQAELMGCQWSLELGDLKQAREFLDGATILQSKGIDSTYEQAMYLSTRARLDHMDPNVSRDVTADLRAARKMFHKVGDQASAREMNQLLREILPQPRTAKKQRL
jgi:hypothetical protein